VALACNLALADCVELIKSKDGVSDAEARKQAIAYLVPGVILQPSGVFAVIRAQEAGASYIRAS
jgi:intracellular sulfur oxidation DsrE/DsrF family protein